ncbi:hypothetical protein AB835_02460 [Candidatus Endobugula sertula]|uniref:Phospholipid/glycerol acyltransferase domain-containing protein n=1 Tax=Candidatus Endobugula sertula TaxID=62101 RepID=A0A1D2QSW4_9GAMM|nr:hypothetical protein AB835_02460 [Candidatus Endobugula sertula]
MSESSSNKVVDNVSYSVLPTQQSKLLHSMRTLLSTLLLAIWCLVMPLINVVWRLLHIPHLEKCYFVFHSGCCWLFNLRCIEQGEISTQCPTLFLSNHVSYLDVFVLGRSLPAFFIAKSEVANWPILGSLAKIQNTLFFERNSKKVRSQLSIMTEHFNQQGNLILFPEGTSTNGESVAPFKSSLLQSVEAAEEDVFIQPVAIAYTRYKDKMMDRALRDKYAWYADMPFAPHFFSALGLGPAEVVITYHKPVLLKDFAHRKECAQYCQQQIALALSSALQDSQ